VDSSSFDRLTRLFVSSSSRRALGGALLGSLAGLLGLEEAAAAPCPKGKKRCKQKCIPRKQCCTNANCRPGATGRVCRRGKCVCPTGRRPCNGVCIPVANCCGVAGCGAVASGTAECRGGACVVAACQPGFGNCNGQFTDGCETNLQASEQHCGTCNNPCGANQRCCGGQCTDVTTNANCGSCGHACPGQDDPFNAVRCASGKCRLERRFDPGGPYSFTAPFTGSMNVEAFGGGGGNGAVGEDSSVGNPGGGGMGAGGTRTVATVPVNVGDPLRIVVGRVGGNALQSIGGTSGGNGATVGANGQSSSGPGGGGGGGGGGTSEVLGQGGVRLVAASGGGGGGGGGGARGFSSRGGNGGAGGHSNGGLGGNGGPGGVGGTDSGAAQSGGRGFDGGGVPAGPGVTPGVNSGNGRVLLTFDEA
jgi:hypothetical protein